MRDLPSLTGIITLGTAVLPLVACATSVSATDNTSYRDTAAPAVLFVSPSPSSSDVNPAVAVVVTLSESIDPTTVSSTSLAVAGVTGKLSHSGNTLSFRPNAPLKPNSTFSASVTAGIRDLSGNALSAEFKWSFTTSNGASQSKLPIPARPRLWLNKATTLRLVAGVKTNSLPWQQLKSFCDSSGTTPKWDYQGYELSRYASNFALCYRIGKDAGLRAGMVDGYATKALTVFNNLIAFTNYGNDSGYGIRNYVPAIAIVYDWLHDFAGLTDTVKTSARTRMKAWIDWYGVSGYARADDAQTRVSVYLSNYNAGYLLARTLASIAMVGDDPAAAGYFAAAVAHHQAAHAKFDEKIPGGHWPEGWNYGQSVYAFHAQAASALRSATEDNGFTNSQWLSNNIALKLHALAPNGLWLYDDGAWTGSHVGDPRVGDVYVAGAIAGWDSPLGHLAASYVSLARNRPEADDPTIVGQWRHFLFYDPAATGTDLNALAPSYHAQGSGLVTYRSRWNAPNATWGSFVAGPYLSWQGGQDADQGHIAVYKNAPLLVDAGHGQYTAPDTRTIFHNTYTLLNRSGVSSVGQFTNAGDPRCTPSSFGVKSYADGGPWLFVSGDITDSYRPRSAWNGACASPGIARLVRNVFYLRPDLFFVYDQIEKLTSQPQVSPRMHLHFPAAPSGANVNRELTVTNGKGRLQVATVFPANAVATLSGKHLEVAAPGETPLYHSFLHLMRASETSDSSRFPAYAAIAGTHARGAWVDGLPTAETAQRIAVAFADNGTTAVPQSISYQVPAVATQHYVLKLKPNTRYRVGVTTNAGLATLTITENPDGSVMTNVAGLLLVTS